ncbi:MAG: hypothetical protein K6L75_04860 [Cellvibrionaceae bacterium]
MNDYFALFPNTASWIVSLVTFILIVVVLYMARRSAHGLINSVFALCYSTLRLAARSISVAEKKLKERNHEVLIALGKDQVERELNREFFRINKFVERDLGGYPQLQRKIQEQVTAINEDYEKSGEVPVPAPEWIKAVESIAKLELKENGTDLTEKILSVAEEQHRDVLQNYRKSIGERHSILKGMAPYWRKLSNKVDQVGTHLQEMVKRSHTIDQKMAEFEEICSGSNKAERALKASQLTQFVIALVVLAIAVAGAFVNFQLIEYPMREMVDASNRILGIRVSEVAAFVLILLEITLGIFLMEALHITRLFPLVASMDDRMRIRGVWIVGFILLVFALMEASLAFLRDYLQADNYALRADLTGTNSDVSWVTLAVNMGMGFFIPLVLAVIAIPLEYLFHTGRTVIGMLLEFILRLLSVSMRIFANAIRHMAKILIHVYDIIILVPLWVESFWFNKSVDETSVSEISPVSTEKDFDKAL